jgi:hypothetical protein
MERIPTIVGHSSGMLEAEAPPQSGQRRLIVQRDELERVGSSSGPREPGDISEQVDRESDQSFPASDPPGWIPSWAG